MEVFASYRVQEDRKYEMAEIQKYENDDKTRTLPKEASEREGLKETQGRKGRRRADEVCTAIKGSMRKKYTPTMRRTPLKKIRTAAQEHRIS